MIQFLLAQIFMLVVSSVEHYQQNSVMVVMLGQLLIVLEMESLAHQLELKKIQVL